MVVTDKNLYLGANKLVSISQNPSVKSGLFKVTKGDYTKTLQIPTSPSGPKLNNNKPGCAIFTNKI